MTSNKEWLLCHNGDVLGFRLSKGHFPDKGHAEPPMLHVRRMTFDREKGTFVQKATGFFQMQEGKCPLKIIWCNCVSDCRTGIKLPCVMIQGTNKCNVFTYFLLIFHSTSQFEKRLYLRLNYQLHEFRVLNGPMLLWKHVKTFYRLSSKTDEAVAVPIMLSSIDWAGEIENLGMALLGIKEHSSGEEVLAETTSELDFAVQNTKFCLYSLESQEKLSESYIIPAGYTSSVTSVLVCSTEFINNQLRLSLIVLTGKNQLIFFQNGAPQGVCQLPFEEPCAVQLMDGGEDLLYLVSFKSNKACAVWNKNFQVAAQWENIDSVLIDDFIGTGSEQVLLLSPDSWSSDCLSSFKITNFGDINYPIEPVECNENDLLEDKEKNRCLVIPPLKRRVEIGLTSVQDWKQHLLLKEKFIAKYFKTFINIIQGKDDCTSTTEEECLVTLCGEEETSVCAFDEQPSGNFQLSEAIVEKIWYRVIDDNLVVGVKTTSSLLSENHVTLSLLMAQTDSSNFQPITCQNKVLQLRRRSQPAPVCMPYAAGAGPKRIKLAGAAEAGVLHSQPSGPEHTCMVTAVTSLPPLLRFGGFSCLVLLQCSREREPGQHSEEASLRCGRISITLADLSRGKSLVPFPKAETLEHVEDLFALLAACHKNCFQITSPTYALTSVTPWLSEHMQCEVFTEFPEIWFCKRPGSFYGTLFEWKQTTPFEGILLVYYRNQTVLFQCLHDLSTVLPVNGFIKNLKSEREDILIAQLARSLEKELVTLSTLSSPLAENINENAWVPSAKASEETSSDSPSVLSKEDIQLIRKELESKKQQTMAMGEKVSGALYREKTLRLTEIQLHSDLIVQKLSDL
ncbi:Fanconi anemia group B protein [Sorex araneus]|uniref:Fanconi anemia group B protein n=1 Tax=Sorex araneus TaxID=42254 RepID=UPI002433F265|nr:Fanconi anemia group B protein [Sorex araneus]